MNKKLEKSLMNNETVVKEAKFTNMQFMPSIFLFVFTLLALSASESLQEALEIFFSTIFMCALLALPGIKYRLTNVLAITNKKIYGRIGLIKTSELESPLNKIQNIQIKQSFWGRIFKYGTVSITTDSGIYTFKYISKAEDFKKAIMNEINQAEYGKMDIQAEKIATAIKK